MKILRDSTYDAVIVVPGIMGSALRDKATKELLWGFTPKRYLQLWRDPAEIAHLHVTARERDGDTSRVEPAGLISGPAWAPIVKGMFGYGVLTKALRGIVADRGALAEFAYDWRLSVEHNAKELALFARGHLTRWRQHRVHEERPVRGETPGVVFVAHSMGGLLVRALGHSDPGLVLDIRVVVTLGTPFEGSVNAVLMLALGEEGPPLLNRSALQQFAVTAPGVYDLLPTYRCVDDGGVARALTSSDIGSIGGAPDLADAAFGFAASTSTHPVTNLRAVAGFAQRTWHTVEFRDGLPLPAAEDFVRAKSDSSIDGTQHRRICTGDGTVPFERATIAPVESIPVDQRHSALSAAHDLAASVARLARRRETIMELGVTELGLDVPDVAAVGERFTCELSGADVGTQCVLRDAETGKVVARPHPVVVGNGLELRITVEEPGLYSVEAKPGGSSEVKELVLVVPPSL